MRRHAIADQPLESDTGLGVRKLGCGKVSFRGSVLPTTLPTIESNSR